MSGSTDRQAEIKPDHAIIWLDQNMGKAENNRTSKIDLSTNVDVDSVPSQERAHDIDNLINSCGQNRNDDKFNNLIKSPLRMFTDVQPCLECIRENVKAKKRIFLIASGVMGALIVPEIHETLSGYIYIFCANVEKHLDEWAGDYIQDMQMFNEETTLFIRLLRDLARYYIKKSEETFTNQAAAIQYLQWARRLVSRANKMDKDGGKALLAQIEEKLNSFKTSQTVESDLEDEGKGAEPDEG